MIINQLLFASTYWEHGISVLCALNWYIIIGTASGGVIIAVCDCVRIKHYRYLSNPPVTFKVFFFFRVCCNSVKMFRRKCSVFIDSASVGVLYTFAQTRVYYRVRLPRERIGTLHSPANHPTHVPWAQTRAEIIMQHYRVPILRVIAIISVTK